MSATGQYLKPILERATVKPKVVETKPKKVPRSRRVTVDEDELNLADGEVSSNVFENCLRRI